MSAIRFQIEQVVQEINTGSEQAEGCESESAEKHAAGISQTMRSQNRHENENVLRPLMRTQRAEDARERAIAKLISTGATAFTAAMKRRLSETTTALRACRQTGRSARASPT